MGMVVRKRHRLEYKQHIFLILTLYKTNLDHGYIPFTCPSVYTYS